MAERNIIEIFERVAELRDVAEKNGFTELAHFLEAAANVAQDMAFQGHMVPVQGLSMVH